MKEFRIPKRVYNAIKVIAETYGGIGGNREQTEEKPISTVATKDLVPFCWWGIAKEAIDRERLVGTEVINAEKLRSIFPQEGDNDRFVSNFPDSQKTPDGRVPFADYVKGLNIVCAPDEEFPTLPKY